MSSDARPKYSQFPRVVQVQRRPNETDDQCVERFMRERFPSVNVQYYAWPDHEIDVVAPQRFTFNLEVV